METTIPDTFTTSNERTHFWRQHYDACLTGDCSRRMYCSENKLLYSRFNYWCQKFALEDEKKAQASNGFAAITIATPEVQSLALCTLELGNARQLQIHNLSALKTVIELLG